MNHLRPTHATVDLAQLSENLRTIRRHIPSETKVLASVKGDAYGHGALGCARALADAGVDWFGVALVEEGRALRKDGIQQPILCMGGAGPRGAHEAIKQSLTPLISHLDEADALNVAAKSAGVTIDVHAKVDTGMGRLGVPLHLWAHFLDRTADLTSLRVSGIASHLAQSESESGIIQTREQLRRFREAIEIARTRGLVVPLTHVANSGAILQHPETAYDMVRPGLLLYGYDPGSRKPRIAVRPVMTVETQVLIVRDLPAGVGVSYGNDFVTQRPSRIATLPVGYADGYPRALSGRASVLIAGHRAPLRGRVCMDMCMIDVTELPFDVNPGDAVTLLGRSGDQEIDAWDLAAWADTIPYEILTGFSERIPRVS